MMKDCIFCRIVAGELSATKVYEDDLVLAFLDIAPINPGHLLVIPKEHHESISTVPEAVVGRMMRIAGRLGTAQRRALDADGFNLHLADGACAGQVVMHAHLHVIPRHAEDAFHWGWRQQRYSDDAARDAIAARILDRFRLD